ncbi:hypothetical protein [Winogradskyella sp. PE311]|uniref:hypothetical protein n=1 Tax=Winogradskyella sp. PE311 TaxID=3366943 RepID=UPI00397FDB1C
MKDLFKRILVVAVMLGTYTSYASETLEINTLTHNVEKGNKITVTDGTGEIIYIGLVNYDGNLTNLFDFSQLRDGNYTVEVNKDFVIEINSINVKNNVVTFNSNIEEKIYKPVFRIENSKIIISKLALDNKGMDIKLYYNDEVIFSETVKGEKILNRIYQLDNSFKGEYTTVIRSNDRVFVETFRI